MLVACYVEGLSHSLEIACVRVAHEHRHVHDVHIRGVAVVVALIRGDSFARGQYAQIGRTGSVACRRFGSENLVAARAGAIYHRSGPVLFDGASHCGGNETAASGPAVILDYHHYFAAIGGEDRHRHTVAGPLAIADSHGGAPGDTFVE